MPVAFLIASFEARSLLLGRTVPGVERYNGDRMGAGNRTDVCIIVIRMVAKILDVVV